MVYTVTMPYLVKVMRHGNSLVISLPRPMVEHLGIRKRDIVALVCEERSFRGARVDEHTLVPAVQELVAAKAKG